jgi:hypothetical protein
LNKLWQHLCFECISCIPQVFLQGKSFLSCHN